MAKTKSDRIGQIRKNKYGSLMEIVEYKGATNVLVKFLEHGNLVNTSWQQFCNGEVKNPYDKSIVCIGYLGEGKYKAYINRKATPQYMTWKHMLERCYDEKLHKRYSTYINCIVTKEWHNFQNFGKWYDKNFYKIEGEQMCLDKDILYKGNKIYSPDTCVFAPKRINILFTKKDADRGEFPIGVTYIERDNVYTVRCCTGGEKNERKSLGSYNNPEEAFQIYKKYKEEVIKKIAKDYEDKIPTKLYEAMFNYNVEIND